MLLHVYPQIQHDTVESVIFALTYTQHGGSGLGWTRRDVLDCPWGVAQETLERLSERRSEEAKQLRNATKA